MQRQRILLMRVSYIPIFVFSVQLHDDYMINLHCRFKIMFLFIQLFEYNSKVKGKSANNKYM